MLEAALSDQPRRTAPSSRISPRRASDFGASTQRRASAAAGEKGGPPDAVTITADAADWSQVMKHCARRLSARSPPLRRAGSAVLTRAGMPAWMRALAPSVRLARRRAGAATASPGLTPNWITTNRDGPGQPKEARRMNTEPHLKVTASPTSGASPTSMFARARCARCSRTPRAPSVNTD